MKFVFLITLSCVIIITACHKPGNSEMTPSTTDSAGNLVVVNNDSARFILIGDHVNSYDSLIGEGLICYNLDKSIRWQEENLGGFPSYVAYANGVVYFVTTTRITDSYYKGSLYAVDAGTGREIWKTTSDNLLSYLVVRNDTIFCNYNFTSTNTSTIAALSAKNGSMYWAKTITDFSGPLLLQLDGSTIYFSSVAALNDPRIKFNAFDINTKTIKWVAYISSNLGLSYAKNVITDTLLYIGNGGLYAYDKNSGELIWARDNLSYGTPMFLNGSLYVQGSNSSSDPSDKYICRLNPQTGSTIFQNSMGTASTLDSQPFASGDYIYAFGLYDSGYLKSFNAANGATRWKNKSDYVNTNPVVVGDKLYTLRPSNIDRISKTPLLAITDCNSGKIIDSLVPFETNPVIVGIVTYSGKYLTPN